MSYTLTVKLKGLSDRVIPDWLSEINKFNMTAEVHPDFSFDTHTGFLPFKIILNDCPNRAFNHTELMSGFELFIHSLESKSDPGLLSKWFGRKKPLNPIEEKLHEAETELIFNISAHDSFEFRMGWYSAASLALLCNGVLEDVQEEIQLEGQQLFRHALKVVVEDERTLSEDEWHVHKFEGWLG
ncbi:hypothetical protein FHS18_006576 [Paenibacillus phyllosphaerae]|uniref:Uncharacterized protein n=1 Tax=Paenibacillus phyllosphaerae TaxID=274593 RepID=A0A7W5B4V2_9BACL|nr:hypothetical protein [Paenibacillus phyllosphaerae]MBB3114455.1 hypothetical protein [Paenibacillus phyllosphaerae]